MQQVFPAQPLALVGLAATAAGVAAMGALHVLPPADRINPIRRTISEYALHETAWLFNLGVLSLALGSLAILLALVRAKLVQPFSLGGVGLAVWAAGLTAVVYFPKHNWTVGPSASGDIHRAASLAAFIGLPVAAIAIGWAFRHHERWRVCARWTMACAGVALLFFSVILGAVVLQPFTGVRWFRAIPLGAVERGLGAAEVATVIALGWWALLATRAARLRWPSNPPSTLDGA